MKRSRTAIATALIAVAAGVLSASAGADSWQVRFLTLTPAVGSVTTTQLVMSAPPCRADAEGINIRVSGESFPKPDAIAVNIPIRQDNTIDGYWPLGIGTWDQIANTTGATRPLTGEARFTIDCYTLTSRDAAGSFIGPLVPFRNGGTAFGDPCRGITDCPSLPTPTATPAPTATPPVVLAPPRHRRTQLVWCRFLSKHGAFGCR